MNNEASACTILCKSFCKQGSWAYKIPDPTALFTQTVPRPFDIIAVKGSSYYIEVKYLNKMESFNLQRIEDHQIASLLDIKQRNPEAVCWIVLAVKVGRGDNRFYLFKDIFDINNRRILKKNFLKKELETLNYYKVKNDLIDLSDVLATK